MLANPKTVMNTRYAPKEVKNSVIRADQLIEYIKKTNQTYDKAFSTEKEMLDIARSYLESHIENPKDYTEKYKEYFLEKSSDNSVKKSEEKIICPKCGAEMIKRVATKGQNAGNSFYGCTNFPNCRGIINIKQ